MPVIVIADRDSTGAQSLTALSAATGGAAHQASEPGRIRDGLVDAWDSRPDGPTTRRSPTSDRPEARLGYQARPDPLRASVTGHVARTTTDRRRTT